MHGMPRGSRGRAAFQDPHDPQDPQGHHDPENWDVRLHRSSAQPGGAPPAAKRRRGCDDVKDDLPRHLERRGAPPVPAPAHAKKSKTGGSYPERSAKPRSAGARASLYCVYAVNPTPGCSDHESEHDRAGTGLVKHVILTKQDAQITRVSTTGPERGW